MDEADLKNALQVLKWQTSPSTLPRLLVGHDTAVSGVTILSFSFLFSDERMKKKSWLACLRALF